MSLVSTEETDVGEVCLYKKFHGRGIVYGHTVGYYPEWNLRFLGIDVS